MPKREEVAEIVVNGQRFRDWTSVRFEGNYENLSRTCTFTAVEDGAKPARAWSGMRIKPGDRCQVFFGGVLVLTGYVYIRQAAYDANSHGVQIQAGSLTRDLMDGTVKMSETQFKNYSWPAIAKKLIKPFGIDLTIKTPPPNVNKKFRDVSAWPGESVYSFIERLARSRGLFLHDDENGKLVARQGTDSSGAQIVEGKNVLAANCIIRDDTLASNWAFYGQHQGHDQRWGEQARGPAAEATGSSNRYREKHIPMEDQADDSEDAKLRAEHERNWMEGKRIEAIIKLQGWFDNGGNIWSYGKDVSVKAPMLLLDQTLAVKSVVLQQDSAGGSTSTLTLCKREHLQSFGSINGSPQSGNGLLPSDNQSPGKQLSL